MNINRAQRVAANMRTYGIRQILVTSPASVAYLTGVWVEPGERMLALMMDADGGAVLFANRMFAFPGGIVDVVEYDDTDDCIARLKGHIAPGELGIDKTWPSQFTLRLMAARPDVRPVLGSAPVDDARMIKDADETARLRASSALNDRVLEALCRTLAPGVTEAEACARYRALAREMGAGGDSFSPLICFGANGAEPHHAPGETRLSENDTVILDVGLNIGGALSDMTRTVFTGEPDALRREVYGLVQAANAAGRAAVRPGVKLCDIDRAARDVIARGGYGENFIHRTGHGIGMEVHEPPDVSAVSETVAQPGMVFSVEPGIYLPGAFGVRIEDLVAVTEDGCETLNHLTRDMTVLF